MATSAARITVRLARLGTTFAVSKLVRSLVAITFLLSASAAFAQGPVVALQAAD
jgi:hypothetical protein